MKLKGDWVNGIVGGIVVVFLGFYVTQSQKKNKEIDNMGDQIILMQKDIQNINSEFSKIDYQFNSLMTRTNKVDDKVDSVYNNVYRKSEINSKFNRVETDLKEQTQRLGNVMYNDRQELNKGISINHERLLYLYGIFQLNKTNGTNKTNEKINLNQ